MNIYSIDVVIGSLMMGIFAVRILEVHPPACWYLILALAVWVFYTTDHLLDALKGKNRSTIPRHLVHYTNRHLIIPLWLAATIIAGVMAIIKLDLKIIYGGLLLGGLILAYFIVLFFNRKRFPWLLQKELIIGVIYVTGIWMAPLVWYGSTPSGIIMILMGNMILLAWSEGILLSGFELEEDLRNKHTSFATMFGKRVAGIFVTILLIFVISSDVFLFFYGSYSLTIKVSLIIQTSMSLILFLLQFFPEHFYRHQLYRYVGEFTFWLPGLILLV